MRLGSYYDLLDPSGGQLDTGKLFNFLTQKSTFGPLYIGVLGLRGPIWTYLGLFGRPVGVPGPIRKRFRDAGMRLGSYYDLLHPSGGQLDTEIFLKFWTQKWTFGPLYIGVLGPLHFWTLS